MSVPLAGAASLAATLPSEVAPLQASSGVTPATLTGALTAAVGLFVAYQAYRGYRRNDSHPMLFLGVGIFLVTTVPFVVTTLLVSVLFASDAAAVLAWATLEILGLGSILYALTGA
ncbi:DUF7521 family protein [Halosimplex halobium]|uniref:DUF7521 family protein n=1 Tax=Halosimplex halobium TaxID=3396618 RepID=UPI003F553C2F